MTFNNKKYGQLLVAVLPRKIDSDAEYDRLEAIFADLLNKGENLAPEEDALFDLLADLLEDYEKRTFPRDENCSPAQMLRIVMEHSETKQKDLIDIFKTQSVVSEVLNEKREINKNQAKALAKRFKMHIEAFI